MIRDLTKIVLIILLLAIPAYCCEIYIRHETGDYIITIDNVTNVGVCDLNLTFDPNLVNITNITGGDFDYFDYSYIDGEPGDDRVTLRTQAFQTISSGLNGMIDYARIGLWINENEEGVIDISVIELAEESLEVKPISYTVQNFRVSTPPSATDSPSSENGNKDGGNKGGTYPPGWFETPTTGQTATSKVSPTAASIAPTSVRASTPTVATTPESGQVTEFRTEPVSLPPPILTPIAGIVIVVITAIFGIVKVIGITANAPYTAHARGEADAETEATPPAEGAEWKKTAIAIIGIVVVAIAAIIGILLI